MMLISSYTITLPYAYLLHSTRRYLIHSPHRYLLLPSWIFSTVPSFGKVTLPSENTLVLEALPSSILSQIRHLRCRISNPTSPPKVRSHIGRPPFSSSTDHVLMFYRCSTDHVLMFYSCSTYVLQMVCYRRPFRNWTCPQMRHLIWNRTFKSVTGARRQGTLAPQLPRATRSSEFP